MSELHAARFRGDVNLAKCLNGTAIHSGNTDPDPSVARLQQALNDDQCAAPLALTGLFDGPMEAVVKAYKGKYGLTPVNGVVDAGMMAHLDSEYSDELVRKAIELSQGTPFASAPADKTPSNEDDERAVYTTANGEVVQDGKVANYQPNPAKTAAAAAEGGEAAFGFQLGPSIRLNPNDSSDSRWFIEYSEATHIFTPEEGVPSPPTPPFTLSRAMWEASVAGFDLIGLPTGGPTASEVPEATIVPHERGVVLACEGLLPQPLPKTVYDKWVELSTSAKQLGPPAGFCYTSTDTINEVYPFWYGKLLGDGTETS